MKPDDDSEMVLREPAAAWPVEVKAAECAAEKEKQGKESGLLGGQSIVANMDEFTTGLIRAFGEAKDKAIRENIQVRAGE